MGAPSMIPEAAVEAAAKAYQSALEGAGQPLWDDLPQARRDIRLRWAKEALEAAAPHMMAALADEADRDSKADPGYPYAPSAAAAAHRWLRVKADGS